MTPRANRQLPKAHYQALNGNLRPAGNNFVPALSGRTYNRANQSLGACDDLPPHFLYVSHPYLDPFC